jgi:HEAT repeat protein
MPFLAASEETAVRRIYSHLTVHDPRAAVKEAEQFLKSYPESQELKLAYLQALAEKGDENGALSVWEKSHDTFLKSRHALEILAWGVLGHGGYSQQVNIQLTSLIGAALTRDVRAVPLLVQAMRSSQAVMRLIGVNLSTLFGDGPLQEELARLVSEEKVWFVRQEAISAVGALRMKGMRGALKEIIAHGKTLAEEKTAAILALVQMYDNVRKEDLKHLLGSDRAGLRELGCQLISYFNLQEEGKAVMPLLDDTSSDVREAALQTLGLLKVTIPEERLKRLMQDPFPGVAISASYVAALQQNDIRPLKAWLSHPQEEWRLEAAACLTKCGEKGLTVAAKELHDHSDPLVKMNLALGLIGERRCLEEASNVLYEMLHKETLLMWDQSSPFRLLAKSDLRHREQIPNYPKMVDQMVRLELLNVLAILRHPKAQEAIKAYLKTHTFGVTGVAVAVLMEEGDDEALELAKSLLQDKDVDIRVQAAFILAMMGNDPVAVKVLQEAYPEMAREMKIQILEAIGQVGDRESIPFLIEVLKEPFQILRVAAASAMIRCLYH